MDLRFVKSSNINHVLIIFINTYTIISKNLLVLSIALIQSLLSLKKILKSFLIKKEYCSLYRIIYTMKAIYLSQILLNESFTFIWEVFICQRKH